MIVGRKQMEPPMGIREWGCTNYVLVRKHNIGADL